MKYRDWYNSEVANKLSEIKYNMECAYFSIDCDDPMDLDADVIAMPTPHEFIDWINEKGQYFVTVNPQPSYRYENVFSYTVWKLDYDDHYVLMLYESNFKTHQEAYDQAAYDLLMELVK